MRGKFIGCDGNKLNLLSEGEITRLGAEKAVEWYRKEVAAQDLETPETGKIVEIEIVELEPQKYVFSWRRA